MVTIGVDPHKRTHSAVAVNEVGGELDGRTAAAVRDGFGTLLLWARALPDPERVWVIEDCRHLSGPLERFLLDFGETVVRLAPHLMAGARQSVRERGKSDPIDALAVARAALREGIESLPAARLAGPELEIRQLVVHRQRLVDARTRLINELRWELHDLWPGWEIPTRALKGTAWQQRVARRLQRAQPTVRVRVARDEIRRIRDLTRTITELHQELAVLVAQVAPQLLAERGLGVILAAKLIGEIAGIDRFASDAQLARMAGCAPIPSHPVAPTATAWTAAATASSTTRSTCSRSAKSPTTPAPRSISPNNAPAGRPTKRRSGASSATSSAASTTSSKTPRTPPAPSSADRPHPPRGGRRAPRALTTNAVRTAAAVVRAAARTTSLPHQPRGRLRVKRRSSPLQRISTTTARRLTRAG
jgi:transposase